MNKLSVGGHTVTAAFSDGGVVTAVFTVKDKPAKPKDNVVTCQMAGFPDNYAWNEAAKACQPGYLDENGIFHSAMNSKRTGVPNTYDKGISGHMNALILSMISSLIAALLLVKYGE